MYSKTRNSLTALVASLLLTSTWMLGQPLHPAQADVRSIGNDDTAATVAAASTHVDTLAAHGHRSLRLRLAMPYYSFSLTTFDRGAD